LEGTRGGEALYCPVARNQGTARETPAKSQLLKALVFTQMKLHYLEQRSNTGWKGEVPKPGQCEMLETIYARVCC